MNNMSFNSWNINIENEFYKNELLKTIIYDDDHKKYNNNIFFLNTDTESFTIIEKFVYEIAMFHFNRLGITYDANIHDIEFWIKHTYRTDTSLHIDHNENERKLGVTPVSTPILSTVTYFIDNDNTPTIITNIKTENIFNELDPQEVYLSFPKFLKHISFNGGKYYHNMLNLYDLDNSIVTRPIIAIGLWGKKIKNTNNENYKIIKEGNSYHSIKETPIIYIKETTTKKIIDPYVKINKEMFYFGKKSKDNYYLNVNYNKLFQKYFINILTQEYSGDIDTYLIK